MNHWPVQNSPSLSGFSKLNFPFLSSSTPPLHAYFIFQTHQSRFAFVAASTADVFPAFCEVEHAVAVATQAKCRTFLKQLNLKPELL